MSHTITIIEPDALARIAAEHDLAPAAAGLLAPFSDHFASASEIVGAAADLVVTDATQVTEIRRSRELRLALKAVRVASDKTRKALKEESLRTGRAVDGAHNILLHLVEPVEARLEANEQFAIRAEAARKQALADGRSAMLAPYGVDPRHYALAEMDDAAFTVLLNGLQRAKEERAAAEAAAEAARIAAEQARAAEEARIRAENERLRREAEAAERAAAEERAKAETQRRELEAKAKAEREAAERVAASERAAREKAERELKAKADSEAKAAKEAAAAAAKAARAPDRERLAAYAVALAAVPHPVARSDEAAGIFAIACQRANTLAVWIKEQADAL